MSEITLSGEGLGVLIACRNLPMHHWLSFASWYAVKRYLPDAQVILACVREKRTGLFGWAYRAGAKLCYHSATDLPELAKTKFPDSKLQLVISPCVMAVREFDSVSLGPVPAKSEENATFVDCEGGCGKFLPSIWVDKIRAPFRNASMLLSVSDMMVNELKVLKLWEDCQRLYVAMQ